MKCKQVLCQRTKNLQTNGNCNVWDDAIKKVVDQRSSGNKKVEHISVDLNLMTDVHTKLSNGIPVDQKVVSGLLLSGIVNILNQHDSIEALAIMLLEKSLKIFRQ